MARDSPKFGAGHLGGMVRQGLRELRAALYPESNVAQQPDYGILGNPTPAEISDKRKDKSEKGNIYKDDGPPPPEPPQRDGPEME